jgi:hypothetical protein
MFSTNNLNEAMLEQIRASDQWSFYQAKGIKLAVLEGRLETLPALGKPVADADTAKAERYQHEQQDISTEAKAHQSSAELHRARYTSFSRAATAFQIGIALAAVALLVRKNWFWMASLIVALGGCTFFVLGLLPH